MFGIHWLRGRVLVEKQSSDLALLADVDAVTRRGAREVGARHPGNVPDSFKIFDGHGKEMGQYTLS